MIKLLLIPLMLVVWGIGLLIITVFVVTAITATVEDFLDWKNQEPDINVERLEK